MNLLQNDEARRFAVTLALAALGGAAFAALGLPAPWLSGATIVAALWALVGRAGPVNQPLREVAFLVLGVSMGAGLTPEAVRGIVDWPLSIAVLILTIPAIVGASALVLVKARRWNAKEACLASMPGALSYVIAIALDNGLDVRRIAIPQTLRLMLMASLMPLVMGATMHPVATGARFVEAGASGSLVPLLCGLALGAVLWRLAMPAPLLLGGLIASGALHASGIVATTLPSLLVIPALIVTGTAIGSRFAGTDPNVLRQIALDAVLAFLTALAVAALSAMFVAHFLGLPLAQTLLAFAPGGIEATIVIAFALGLDPAFVATHQLIRFFAIALILPLVFDRVSSWLDARA